MIVGKSYKISFSARQTGGTGNLQVGQAYFPLFNQSITSSFANYSFFITPNNYGGNTGKITIGGFVAGDTFEIDNVSVKEVGQDWTLGSGWSIGDDKASCDGSQSSQSNLYQAGIVPINNTYKVTFDIVVTSGSIILAIGGSNAQPTVSSSGTYTFTSKATTGDSNLYFSTNSNFIGSITNISVKEVGQDWTLGTGWSIGDGVAKSIQTSTNNYLQQTISTLANNKLYRVTFDLDIISATTTTIGISNTGAFGNLSSSERFFTTSGTKTFDAIYSNSFPNYIRFVGGVSTEYSIDNISVKEITDDTDLPRINYEGFSYQDSLGSEEVVNGSFDTDSDWTKGANWTIANGSANSNGSGLIYQTSVSYVDGKTYKVTFDANITSGGGTVRLGNTTSTIAFTNGANEFYLQTDASNTTRYIFFQGISLVGSIDNVSVKEVLGQEVVPDSGCGSWLLEPQSTNLITYSEDYSNSAWNKSNLTATGGQLSPKGDTSAYKLVGNGTADFKYLEFTSPITNALYYTFSVFAKKDTLDYIQLIGSGAFLQNHQNFDLINGVVGTNSNVVSSEIKEYPNGWYKCSVTLLANYTFNTNFYIVLANSASMGRGVGFTTSGSVYVSMAQIENQSYATSYIPTNWSNKH